MRPSLRKRETILQWPTLVNQEEVEAFCYLTPFLRQFIPGRAELVRILKHSGEELKEVSREKRGKGRNKSEESEEFRWDRRKGIAFQAIKQAIANNAMASPDPTIQYHLAVDVSKRGICGVLFQLDGIPGDTEAISNAIFRVAEQIIMFLSFRLSDAETRYSNSEREALAVIRCLAEVTWMVIASLYLVMVYTDHEALKMILTGADNEAHGRIAKWQERLGEYNLRLLHRSARTHFIGIADGLSRLPTRLLNWHFAEDTEGLRPCMAGIVRVSGVSTDVRMNAALAVALRNGSGFWRSNQEVEGIAEACKKQQEVLVGIRGGFIGTISEERDSGEEEPESNVGLGQVSRDMRRERWQKWLRSEMYGKV